MPGRRLDLPGDAVRVKLAKDLNLLLDIVDLILCALQVDDLDRYWESCASVVTAVDFTERPLACGVNERPKTGVERWIVIQ